MSPLPIPPSETIESFPASSSSKHAKSSHPLNQSNVPPKYVSSPIEGFTTSNSDDRKGSSSTNPSRDPQMARIMLSAPTEHVRARPQPKQRRKADQDAMNGSPMDVEAGPSDVSGQASGSRSKPAEESSAAKPSSPQGSSPVRSKRVVVYSGRSIHHKKRKIMLSDSEAEEDTAPATIDQELATPVVPAEADRTSAKPDSKRKNQSDGEDRPSKKSRGREDVIAVEGRGIREGSIDPLDLGHVDANVTPVKNRVVVEIDSGKRSGKEAVGNEGEDDDVIVISTDKTKAKPKPKAKSRAQDDDEDDFDDDDPFEGLAPDAAMADSGEEDDFVPPGRKRKPAAKPKKAPAKKEKKPPKAKKGSASKSAAPTPATVSTVDDHVEAEPEVTQSEVPGTASIISVQAESAKAVGPKKGAKTVKNAKDKAVIPDKPDPTPTQSTSAESVSSKQKKNAEKSAEFIESDQEDEVLPSSKKPAAKSTAGSEKMGGGSSTTKSKSKGKVIASDAEDEEEARTEADVSWFRSNRSGFAANCCRPCSDRSERNEKHGCGLDRLSQRHTGTSADFYFSAQRTQGRADQKQIAELCSGQRWQDYRIPNE